MAYIIPKFLVLHFCVNSNKKKQSYRFMKICIKMRMKTRFHYIFIQIFIHIFMQIFIPVLFLFKDKPGQLKQQMLCTANFLYAF